MGQRCTVVLPLLLAEPRESILLDQPEDHLDNAFIVDTLVTAIRERSRNGQALVATHNANIPVLGGAERSSSFLRTVAEDLSCSGSA